MFAKEGGRFVGCYIFMLFPTLDAKVGEFACVSPDRRNRGIADFLMSEAETRYPTTWLFGEVEKENTFNRRHWGRRGFKAIDVPYHQLSLGDGRLPSDALDLCVRPKDPDLREIDSALVRDFVGSYYRHSQFCPDVEHQREYLELAELCGRKKAFELVPLFS